jgi:hypothetical protein
VAFADRLAMTKQAVAGAACSVADFADISQPQFKLVLEVCAYCANLAPSTISGLLRLKDMLPD